MVNTDSYVVWDVPGASVSIVINLELVDALKRAFQSRGRRGRKGIFGILLGRRSTVTHSHRSLLSIEDCQIGSGEHDGTLSRLGVVTADDTVIGERDEILMLVRQVAKDGPIARLFWRGEHTQIPLDSARLQRDGFILLHGSPASAREPIPAGRSNWRQFVWIPMLGAVGVCLCVIFWPEREAEQPITPEMVESPAPETPAPVMAPLKPPAPKPAAQRRPAETRRRLTPPTVAVELNLAPESAARRMVDRVPALPLLRRFQVKDDQDFVAPNPLQNPKPPVPPELAEKFPGEWSVELRVAIDKDGQVSHISNLESSANSEFVNLARAAVSRWTFEPARLHDRPVASALDVTIRFRNPAPANAGR